MQPLVIDIVNVSAGGMGFKTNHPLQPGTICNLVLFNGNLAIESHVRSCFRVERKRERYRVGVEFTKVSAQILEEVVAMQKRFKARVHRIKVKLRGQKDPIAVISFPDQLTETDNEEMGKQIEDQLDEDVRRFVMDFDGVMEMDDLFLQALVDLDEEIREEGGVIMMANSSSQLLCTPQVAELATIIPIFESVDKAVTTLRAGNLTPKEAL